MDYLKKKSVFFEGIGEKLTIRQISHKAMSEMVSADKWLFTAIALKHCVVEWEELSAQEIANGLSGKQISEIYEAIAEFSGLDEKNSESVPTGSSSSN